MLEGTVESVLFKGVHYEMMVGHRRNALEGAFHHHAAAGLPGGTVHRAL